MDSTQYEILALTLRYWYVALCIYVFFQTSVMTLKEVFSKKTSIEKRTGNVPFVMVLFTLSAFGLLAFIDGKLDIATLVVGILISAVFLFQFYFMYMVFRGIDTTLLLIVDTLTLLGLIMLQRLTPELALKQVEWFAIGNIFLAAFIVFTNRLKYDKKFMYFLMIAGILLLLVVSILGESEAGARRAITVGPVSVQPSEFVKIIYILVLALYFKDRKSFFKSIPLFIFVGLTILIVVAQTDLGSALHYFLLFIIVYYISTSNWFITMLGIGAFALCSVISYKLFSHVRVRVQIWKDPWSDPTGTGYQLAQALIAMSSGGLTGLGLGMGQPFIIPASRTDFIFSAICEEMGILIGIMIIGFYILIIIKGLSLAVKLQDPLDTLLVTGATVSLAIQAFIIIGGVIKFIPLTGITLPFISYGGSSFVVALSLIGIIQGVTIKNYWLENEIAQQEEAGEYYDD